MKHPLTARLLTFLLALVALPALAVPNLSKVLGQDDEEFLPPDEAFVFRADFSDDHTVRAQWVIADDYYLYQQQFRVEIEGEAAELGEIAFPEGKIHTDEYFGEQEVYYQDATLHVPVAGTPGETFQLSVRYQGCADAGLCYPPQFKTVELTIPDGNTGDIATATQEVQQFISSAGTSTSSAGNVQMPEQDRLADMIRSGNIAWVMLAFVGFGLLLTFTPCVLPMVPILSSIIVGQKDITTRKAFVLSLVYVLAMAFTYTIAGVLAGLFGANLQVAFQDPVVLSVFAAIFVLLSLSMFGFYELQVPASWQAKLSQLSSKQEGGTLPGVAVMGFLSALIVGPCITAPLTGALIVIGQSGDPVRGGLALFALSIGMGIPLLLIGTGFGKFVPKAGGWMDAVKGVFGVMLIGVAIYLLERIVPGWVNVAMWAALAIVSAVYMGAFAQPPSSSGGGWQKLWKGLGLIVFIWGLAMLVGLAMGRASIFTPLKGLSGGGSAAVEEEHLPFKMIKSVDDLERELAAASEMNKPVMLDFYADWCISCKEMEKYTFTDPAVRQALSNYVLLQADVTANDEKDQALLDRFGLYGPPGIIFFSRDAEEQRNLRVVGYMPPEEFAAIAQQNQ
ncbi:MAG: protein-disulfide reductase DsbD [Gammaproteobacteria bacterium]|nr:protein-disulfide reductase DsbD [Gammaproteobacteria bacterium]